MENSVAGSACLVGGSFARSYAGCVALVLGRAESQLGGSVMVLSGIGGGVGSNRASRDLREQSGYTSAEADRLQATDGTSISSRGGYAPIPGGSLVLASGVRGANTSRGVDVDAMP